MAKSMWRQSHPPPHPPIHPPKHRPDFYAFAPFFVLVGQRYYIQNRKFLWSVKCPFNHFPFDWHGEIPRIRRLYKMVFKRKRLSDIYTILSFLINSFLFKFSWIQCHCSIPFLLLFYIDITSRVKTRHEYIHVKESVLSISMNIYIKRASLYPPKKPKQTKRKESYDQILKV